MFIPTELSQIVLGGFLHSTRYETQAGMMVENIVVVVFLATAVSGLFLWPESAVAFPSHSYLL